MPEIKITPQQAKALENLEKVKNDFSSLSQSFGNNLKNIKEEFLKRKNNKEITNKPDEKKLKTTPDFSEISTIKVDKLNIATNQYMELNVVDGKKTLLVLYRDSFYFCDVKNDGINTYEYSNKNGVTYITDEAKAKEIKKNIWVDLYRDFKLGNTFVTNQEVGIGRQILDPRPTLSGRPVVLKQNNNGTWEFEGKTCTQVYANVNGDLRFTTKEFDKDNNVVFTTYFLDKNEQNYISKNTSYMLGAGVTSMSLTQFKHNNLADITKTKEELNELGKKYYTREELKQDALSILNKAKIENKIPIFHLASHGKPGVNEMTGKDTELLSAILDAINETNYDKPIMIENMHCFSGVTLEEMNILKNFPEGSMLLKSQDNRRSAGYAKISQSPVYRKDSSLIDSLVYFSDYAIVNDINNMTCAIVTNKGEAKLYSEDGTYSIQGEGNNTIKSETLPDTISKEILDELVIHKKLLGNSIFALKCLDVSLNSAYHR